MPVAATGVSVGAAGVSVATGLGVLVGGTEVSVGGTGVLLDGTEVLVGGTGVFVGGTGVLEEVQACCWAQECSWRQAVSYGRVRRSVPPVVSHPIKVYRVLSFRPTSSTYMLVTSPAILVYQELDIHRLPGVWGHIECGIGPCLGAIADVHDRRQDIVAGICDVRHPASRR